MSLLLMHSPENYPNDLLESFQRQQHHLTNIVRRVRTLSEIHRDYRFVGICLNTDREIWKTLIDSYSLDPEDQFWAGDFEKFVQTLVVDNTY